ncbi:hypothetical protein SK45_01523 [Enterobacter hormaechei]|nr:hypothetical protein SK45_01523 [Enterobacter hormaechei]KLW12173.1 hypothetical protein SK46_00569 [Enterobacter hormaechei]
MENTRSVIIKLSKKDSHIAKLVKEFQSGEIDEDSLVSRVICHLNKKLNDYREAEDRIDMPAW